MSEEQPTYLIVGLGNPGEDYADTRHNAGFIAVDQLASDLRANYWKTECGSVASHVKHGDVPVILAKPRSFMNLSGGPVSQLMKKYGIPPERVIVIHDELDIPSGTLKVKQGGGHAGHNGLRSIIDKTGTRDFMRVRVGIGRPPGRMDTADYVLRPPKGEQADEFAHATAVAADAALSLIDNGLQKTQSSFNG